MVETTGPLTAICCPALPVKLADVPVQVAPVAAAVYREPLWIFYRGPAVTDGLASLAGRRISVGAPGSGTEVVVTLPPLAASNVTP